MLEIFDPNNIPTKAPTAFYAGDSVTWKISLTNFPADTWSLSYTLVNNEETISIGSTADGDDHLIEVSAADTANYEFGRYNYIARVTDGVNVHTVAKGAIKIERNLDNGIYDSRSQNERTLDAINAMIEGKASKDQQSITIEGRSLQRYTFGDLIEVQKHYKRLVDNERRAAMGNSNYLIKARF